VHGYHDNRDAHLRRLRRIEGQVRGLQRQVEDDAYCIDILTQLAAVTKALQSFGVDLVETHLQHCVADAIAAGDGLGEEKVAEASRAIARLLRS
jgi:CsoR family transcriptional regulator, copper-sensing transcriptional repressor